MNHFRQIISPPTFKGDAEKTRRAEVLHYTSIIIFVFILVIFWFNLKGSSQTPKSINWSMGLIAGAQILIQWMIRAGRVNEASIIILTIGWGGVTEVSRSANGIHDVAILGYIMVLLGSGYLLGWQSLIAFSLASIAAIWWLAHLETQGAIMPSMGHPYRSALNLTVIFILIFFVVYFLIKTLTRTLANAQRELDERKQAEAERERLIAELQSKNEELESFTYTVSHDLKAPLITIGGFLGYLEEDVQENDVAKVRRDIERINDAARKINQFLDELLELSRIGRMMNPPEDVPFDEIVQEALGKVQGRLDDKELKVEVNNDLPVVHGDRVRLVEVIQNLLDNAAKFMGNQPGPKVEIGVRQAEDENIFFVKDNGIGIDPQFHEKIFGLFDKLDPTAEGTGIGLALVKRIVEVHGGKIWVESEGKGKGTVFYFTLPISTIKKMNG